jgi:hypothetical protein
MDGSWVVAGRTDIRAGWLALLQVPPGVAKPISPPYRRRLTIDPHTLAIAIAESRSDLGKSNEFPLTPAGPATRGYTG